MRAFSKTTKLAIIGGSLAVALGTGALAAHAQNATADAPAASASASQSPGKDRDKGHAELAKKLGVSEDKLKEAMDSLRSEGSSERGQGEKGERPDKSAMDQKLATALGIDVSKVEQAMSEMRTEREAQHRTELSSRLDEAVTKGSLSSSDKESVLKAFDAGVLGGGGPK